MTDPEKRLKETDLDTALKAMEDGDEFIKVWPNSKGRRHIRLSQDHLDLHVISKGIMCGINRSVIDLKGLEEVRAGHMSEVWAELGSKVPKKELCFSLVIEGRNQPVNLVAPNANAAKLWVQGISHLCEKIEHLNVVEKRGLWVWEYFKKADRDGNGNLNFKEVKKFLDSLNFKSSSYYVDNLLNKADVSNDQVLSYKEFSEFFQTLSWREDIERLYKTYCDKDLKIQPAELLKFLKTDMNYESADLESAKKLIEEYEPNPEYKEAKAFSTYGFMYMLLSDAGDIFDMRRRRVYQDMTHPLSNYCIASSHNTYLVGHQLYGDSSVESYIRALERGCKCVELDCWDGDDDQPVIYHGHTLTSKIKFENVIKAIDTYGFKINPYPVILSIENHCSVEQQNKMASMMKDVFKEKLLISPIDDKEAALPSPEALKGKIIVKGKKLPVTKDNSDNEVSDEDEAADMEDEEVKKKTQNKKNKIKLSRDLSDIIVYTQSRHFHGFEDAKLNSTFVNISSLNEDKARDLYKAEGMSFVNHNYQQLTRIYPKGTRTDSSNYNPIPFWNVGCQIVALNYQTASQPMMLNQAKFRDNGGCGYVLKPDALNADNFNPYFVTTDEELHISVRIISAQQLPKPKEERKGEVIDPYVKISIQGCECDEQSERSSTVKNNGFNPSWDEDPLVFTVKMPELAFMIFEVFDDDFGNRDQIVGKYILPVTCIGSGYRHVHLQNEELGTLQPASIFVHVTLSKKRCGAPSEQ